MRDQTSSRRCPGHDESVLHGIVYGAVERQPAKCPTGAAAEDNGADRSVCASLRKALRERGTFDVLFRRFLDLIQHQPFLDQSAFSMNRRRPQDFALRQITATDSG